MQPRINVIEPTLTTAAGHCYSFIHALIRASAGEPALRIWANRKVEVAFDAPHVEVCRYFHRRLRRIQGYWLYRQLLASPEKLFISTAGRTDLLLLDWAARGTIPAGKVYLYFHWFNPGPGKLQQLAKLAQRQPRLSILAPTTSVAAIFSEAGFSDVRVIPYPISPRATGGQISYNAFAHLLYAGAARRDKGFGQVVDLVAYLHQQQSSLPVVVQTSAEHFGKYDAETLADIERLKAIAYPYLQIRTETLSVPEYERLFVGAIALQLYDATDFADRISGVTLDAFSAGCPVISTPGTWIARMVARFDAGGVVQDMATVAICAMAEQLVSNYAVYSGHAAEAGRVLQQENSANVLYKALLE